MDPIAYKTVIGLDIGQYAVKAVRAVKRGGVFTITHLETLRLPAGMAGPETSAMIARWLEQQGFKGEPCVIGLRGLAVLFQTLTLPPQDPRPAEQAVAMEISRLSEISTEAMLFGFSPIPSDDAVRRFLIALVRSDKAEETLAVARAAGINVVEVVPTPVAAFLVNSVQHDDGAGVVTAYADIGHSGTDVAIGAPGGIRFARSFGQGGQAFTDQLARGKRMTASQAEPVKIASGMDAPDAAQKEALTAAAESWAAEFKSCLAIYRSFFPAAADQPVQVVLAGGGSHLKGLDRFLAYQLALEVRQLPSLPGREEVADPAGYAVACGLALAGTRTGAPAVSLLPADLREAILLRRQKGYWMGSMGIAALVLGISLLGGYRDYQRKTAFLRDQQASLTRCRELGREIERNLEVNARLSRMSSTVLTLLQNGPAFRDVIGGIAEQLPSNCWITLIADANTYFSQENQVKPEARRLPRGVSASKEGEPAVLTGEPAFTRLIVEGYTADPSLASVGKLIASLKEKGFISQADLLGDDKLVDENKEKWGSAGGRRFVIDITL
ncbi:MAG: pilus assembly protein PilM [Kiritimatiellia bacterium]